MNSNVLFFAGHAIILPFFDLQYDVNIIVKMATMVDFTVFGELNGWPLFYGIFTILFLQCVMPIRTKFTYT